MIERQAPPRRWVFISHASGDRKVADALCKAIERRGPACWIASRDIPPSEGYQDSIVQAIEHSCAMILVFTEQANNSQEIKKEIALAGQFLVPVIPVRVEDVNPVGAFRYELITRQWIDLFDNWDAAVDRIVARIAELAAGPVPLVAARGRAGPTRWIGSPKKRLQAAMLLALLAVSSALIGAYVYFRGATPEPADAASRFPELTETRLSRFELCTPPSEYKAGFRHWERVTPDRWTQTYPDGSKEYMNVVGRSRVNECDGSILQSRFDASFQAFIPDKGCAEMLFLFRRLPKRAWAVYVHMESIDQAPRSCPKT